MEEQRKEAILQKKISEQQQQIAEQQEMITEQQRQYAVKQQMIAQEQTSVAVQQKKKADQSKQEAIVARDEAQLQRKEAVAQKLIADKERIKAEESEKNTQRLRLLAVARTMAIQASQLFNTVKDDLPGLLAVEAYQLNKENGGLQNDPVIYAALSAIANDQIIMRGHEDGIRSIVLSKDGKTLFSCGDDDQLLLWKLNNPQLPPLHFDMSKHSHGALRAVGLTHEERWLVTGSTNGDLVIWNPGLLKNPPMVVQGHTSVLNELAMHPSKNMFASAGSDGKLLEWNYAKDQFSKKVLDSVAGKINCVSYNADGTILAYGTGNGALKTISLNGHPDTPVTLQNFKNSILSIAFSKNGKWLAAGLSNGTIVVWNMTDLNARPQEILGRHASGVTALTFSQDCNELASSSYDRTLKLAGFPSMEAKPISIENHDLWVYDIVFTPDDKQLISCSADKTIRIFSTENAMMANKLGKELKRNLTTEEWKKMVGGDIPYKKTRPDLP